ncbi:uncharacterized protein [Amphiura filiformis]|uniref:uncharacterized protein n=1 Tax=Amphiura filiformis TaxID=82378 RepID=UPI003B21D603
MGKPRAAESHSDHRDQRLPKIRIEECGLTVHLKNYNQHHRSRTKRGHSLPEIHSSDNYCDDETGRVEGLLGAKFCKHKNGTKHDDYERFSDYSPTQYVDFVHIGKLNGKNGYRSISHGFEQKTEEPVARLRYHHRGAAQESATDKDRPDEKRGDYRQRKRDVNATKEKVMIRRLANKRSKQTEQAPKRVSTSYGERPTSTDMWVSNQGASGIQTYPMPEFLRHVYETRDAFIETLRSRSGADKISANVRLAQEFTRDRYQPRFDSGMPRRIEQRHQKQHNLDCPLCLQYIPTYYGHVCPPNTPFNKERPHLRSRDRKQSYNSIQETSQDKSSGTQDLAIRQRSNQLASLVIHSL